MIDEEGAEVEKTTGALVVTKMVASLTVLAEMHTMRGTLETLIGCTVLARGRHTGEACEACRKNRSSELGILEKRITAYAIGLGKPQMNRSEATTGMTMIGHALTMM